MHRTARLINKVEGFFDGIKLGYKWRFNRWSNLKVVAYRGHGTSDCLYVRGRVLDDRGIHEPYDSVWHNVLNTIRRIETDEVPGARLRFEFEGTSVEIETDDDGYFDLSLKPTAPLEDGPWLEIAVELLKPASPDGRRVGARAQILAPPPDAEFAVLSDLDDTVVRTGAKDRLRLMRTMLLNNAHSHVPFQGVSALYKALERGPDDRGRNPIFYVSSSPWNFYDLFESFMEAHDVPLGPIFLKDFGVSSGKLLRTGHEEHKVDLAEDLFETYPDLPFVLVGDSGQKDPEIYREIARAHPGRVRAVYIRDVTSPRRDQEVHGIARDIERLGVPVLLAEETDAVAEHALHLGLISFRGMESVRAAFASDGATAGLNKAR